MRPTYNLSKKAEMLQDVQDYDSAKAALERGDDELVPSEVVYAILDGENAIKVWREYRGLSQQETAEKAGISIPYLSQLETNKRKGSLDVLRNHRQSFAGFFGEHSTGTTLKTGQHHRQADKVISLNQPPLNTVWCVLKSHRLLTGEGTGIEARPFTDAEGVSRYGGHGTFLPGYFSTSIKGGQVLVSR